MHGLGNDGIGVPITNVFLKRLHVQEASSESPLAAF